MTDPFDEFEFKPLTEGLGFHKKKGAANNAASPPTPAASNPASASAGLGPLPSRRQSFEDEAIENLLPPLPRKSTTKENSLEENSNSTVDEILKTLRHNQRLDFDNSKQAKQALKKAKPVEDYQATNWNISSTFLDSMLIVASSLLCLIILLVITKADLIANLSQPDEAGLIYVSTLTLFAGVTFIYMLVNRVFLGATPGEWAFDQRIGRPEDMSHPLYALRVAGRCLLVMATGFVTLPILSLIMRRDIAGALTGATLYRKV